MMAFLGCPRLHLTASLDKYFLSQLIKKCQKLIYMSYILYLLTLFFIKKTIFIR